ncbi:MAG: NRDE family protein [Proteobacteria bacterium]|nr:NRDE family protein [Pseudomonadota bacterium]
MCTVVLLRRPDHEWPLLLAANRDEMKDRPWRPPARHWPDRPDIVAGRDDLAGGSWLGINATGVVAGVLNRPGTLGPVADARSRGELVLEALDHADAKDAAAALAEIDPRAFRPFNMVIADNHDAFWLKSLGRDGPAKAQIEPVPPGWSMVTALDRNDAGSSARIRFHLPRWVAASVPDPAGGDWRSWEELLASREAEPGAGPHGAMNIVTETGFGTTSSSLIALPGAAWLDRRRPLWRFGQGHPDSIRYSDVTV